MRFTPASVPDVPVRRPILIMAIAGAAVFSMLFAMSWLYPTVVEQWARKAITHEVQQRVDTHLDGLSNSALGNAAGRLMQRNEAEKAAASETLKRSLPSKISVVMAAMFDPTCPCRNKQPSPGDIEQIRKSAKDMDDREARRTIARLDDLNVKLTALIESKYRDVAQSLHREARIFSGANAALFLLLAGIAFVWKGRALQLLAPTVVLVGAAALTGTIYLVNQDWLSTILFNDYVGLLYLPYLGLALAFMLDVVFNAGQISLNLVTAVAGIFIAPVNAGC